MTLAKELKLAHVVMETNSLGVVSQLTNVQKDRSMHGPLVEEIKSMLRSIFGQMGKAFCEWCCSYLS